ncbi:hypothetical protein D3C71_2053870 [compost metagenome]
MCGSCGRYASRGSQQFCRIFRCIASVSDIKQPQAKADAFSQGLFCMFDCTFRGVPSLYACYEVSLSLAGTRNEVKAGGGGHM